MSDDPAGWVRTSDHLELIHREDDDLARAASRHPSRYEPLSLPPLRVVRD